MSFSRYLKGALPEFALVWLCSWALSGVLFNAFFLTAAQSWRLPFALVACGVLVFALFAASFERRRMAAGVVGYVVLCAVLVGAMLAISTGESPYLDAEGNYLYLGVVVIVCSTLSFLLTRTLAGSIVWFVACAFTCSVVEAFYQSGELVLSAAAALLSLALVVYRNFALGLVRADAAKKSSRAAQLAVSIGAVALSVGAGLAVWFLVIAPLDPGVVKVTLVTDYRQLPIVEMKGVANRQPTLNYDLTSDQLVSGERYTTDDLKKGKSDTKIDAKQLYDNVAASGTGTTGQGNDSGTAGGLDRDSTQRQYEAQSYTQHTPALVFILAAAAAVAVVVALGLAWKRWRRRRRLERMLAQDPMAQMQSIYLFVLSRLSRIGFSAPQGMTLEEYAEVSASRMAVLDAETGVAFATLTGTYVERTCSETDPSEDELVPFVAYYLAFWKAARRQLGRVRYFFKSFRL